MKILGKICFVLLNLFIVYQLGCKEQFGGEISANMPMGSEIEEAAMPMDDEQEVVGAPQQVAASVPQESIEIEQRVEGLEGKMKAMDNKIRASINRYKESLRKKFSEVNNAYRKILQKLSTAKERAREALFSQKKNEEKK